MNIPIICKELKDISLSSVCEEWETLSQMGVEAISNVKGRSRLGCNLLDYYFFEQRLLTIGNKGIHFFDFLEQIEVYKTKPYIQTLLAFCDKNNRYKDSLIKRYYYCYGLCFGRINAFKITNALQMYHMFPPNIAMLDPFCGFGGRMVGAMLLNIDYIGIDLNKDLEPGYQQCLQDHGHKSTSKVTLLFTDSATVDFNKYIYDMVFTSPPYENIEIYPHSQKKTKEEWNQFYKTVFQRTWDSLQSNGTYAINCNHAIYKEHLLPLLGPSVTNILLKKSSKNNYQEYIYIWKK